MSSLKIAQLLLLAIWALIVGLDHQRVRAQQNGEVMVANYNRQSFLNPLSSKSSLILGSQLVQGQVDSVEENKFTILPPSSPATEQRHRIQYIDVNGQPVLVQFTYVGPPKILPIATADSYPEGSTINLICTVSGGQRKGLTLNWLKDNEELSEELLRYSNAIENVSIEKTGADISILRITNATHSNSGKYTCGAKNPLGEDSTSVNIVINVELKWNRVPSDTEVGLNQDLSLECDAIGQPRPQVSWTKHPTAVLGRNDTNKSMMVSQSGLLKLTKAQHKDSGLYECIAKNGVDQDLRRIIQIKVRGK